MEDLRQQRLDSGGENERISHALGVLGVDFDSTHTVPTTTDAGIIGVADTPKTAATRLVVQGAFRSIDDLLSRADTITSARNNASTIIANTHGVQGVFETMEDLHAQAESIAATLCNPTRGAGF